MKRNRQDWLPDSQNLHGWWESFWDQRTEPFGPPSKNLMPFISDEVAKRQSKTLSAVDIASGNGRYAVPMARLGCQVTALEWTECGIDQIRALALKEGVSVQVEKSDYTRSCHEKRTYDLVVCSGLLEEIDPKHHLDVARGFAAWTAPKGISVIKYCLELEGRGVLVESGLVERVFRDSEMEIVFSNEQENMKTSQATGMGSRTGTVIARKQPHYVPSK